MYNVFFAVFNFAVLSKHWKGGTWLRQQKRKGMQYHTLLALKKRTRLLQNVIQHFRNTSIT